MRFVPTPLLGCILVEAEPARDSRGAFARLFDAALFAARGMSSSLTQASVSLNPDPGTLRGLHYQAAPCMETKLVYCARGAVFDVAVDVRPGSPTFGQWFGVELSAENLRQLYIPIGFAHGFQSLQPDTAVHYQIDVPFDPALSAGLRYDDPTLGIDWPMPPRHLSLRDAALPKLAELDHAGLLAFDDTTQE